MKTVLTTLKGITLFCFVCFFFGTCTSFAQKKSKVKGTQNYYVAAYVWPSCHHDERFGDMLWPEGIGEWEIIKRKPTF